jgi:hypothetical protein
MTTPSVYAQRIIDAGCVVGQVPRYASAEFDALPSGDPRRHASVMIAAEAWRIYCSPERVADDMAVEVERDRRAWLADMANAYRAGQESVKRASLDVGDAIDVSQVIGHLRAAEHRREVRAADTIEAS